MYCSVYRTLCARKLASSQPRGPLHGGLSGRPLRAPGHPGPVLHTAGRGRQRGGGGRAPRHARTIQPAGGHEARLCRGQEAAPPSVSVLHPASPHIPPLVLIQGPSTSAPFFKLFDIIVVVNYSSFCNSTELSIKKHPVETWLFFATLVLENTA